MSAGAEYVSQTFGREGESLESYMETVQTGMLNNGVDEPITALKSQVDDPEYSVSLDGVGADVAVDPENAYMRVVVDDTVEEYVLVGIEDGAVGVISEAGGHILREDEPVAHYEMNNRSTPLVTNNATTAERTSLFYDLIDAWEQVQEEEATGREYVDLHDADGQDIRILGNNDGQYEKKYGRILDRLRGDGEVALSKDTHLGGNSERGNHILQNLPGAVRRMEDDRGIDPAHIECEYDENTPVIRYNPPDDQ